MVNAIASAEMEDLIGVKPTEFNEFKAGKPERN
jgi:hypothetical protein